MGIKELYNDNLQKLQNEYGDVSVMEYNDASNVHSCPSNKVINWLKVYL